MCVCVTFIVLKDKKKKSLKALKITSLKLRVAKKTLFM